MLNRPLPEDKQKVVDFGIGHGYIELTEEEKRDTRIIVNKLITTLIYESKRHGFASEQCLEIREHIYILAPSFRNKTKKEYIDFIENQEKLNRTFYGSYPSDDSDSDEELIHHTKSEVEKSNDRLRAKIYRERGQIDKITYKKKVGTKKAGDLKANGKPASSLFDLNERQAIYRGKKVDKNKVVRDLNHLNQVLSRGLSLSEALKELSKAAEESGEIFTPFYIAEYRGVTHLTSKWNKPSRSAHRKDKHEIGERQYSASVYVEAGINLFRDYESAKKIEREQPEKLEQPAELLREILLTFREPKPYSYDSYSYSNLAYVLQNIYTQDYYGFLDIIKDDPRLSEILLNGNIPFVSMGDIPYHALKYAYGLKPYKGHEDERLRPRWRADGRAERPYSGVVYTSLHPITDYHNDGPLHVVTLNRDAEIKLKNELIIVAEHESCFPAYLPENRVIDKHIAKYPSLKDAYKSINHHKYGLSEDEYKKFREGLLQSEPHTVAHKQFKALLGETLCSYQEARLIDVARKTAESKKGVLIYRNAGGTFSLTPPVDSVNRNTDKIAAEDKAAIKKKQETRARLSRADTSIDEISDELSVSTILDSTSGYFDDIGKTNILVENNHVMSFPLSLMLNAIMNQRYLALEHFLKIPMFVGAINETFNTEDLQGSTLLHLAAIRNDTKAMKLLLQVPECRLDIGATQVVNLENCECHDDPFYENITPLHYAVIRSKNHTAMLLMNHPREDIKRTCAFVRNKNLFGSDDIVEEVPDVGQEGYIATAFHHREGYLVERVKENNLFHLAALHENKAILYKLRYNKSISPLTKNTEKKSAHDIAVWKKNDALIAAMTLQNSPSKRKSFFEPPISPPEAKKPSSIAATCK